MGPKAWMQLQLMMTGKTGPILGSLLMLSVEGLKEKMTQASWDLCILLKHFLIFRDSSTPALVDASLKCHTSQVPHVHSIWVILSPAFMRLIYQQHGITHEHEPILSQVLKRHAFHESLYL